MFRYGWQSLVVIMVCCSIHSELCAQADRESDVPAKESKSVKMSTATLARGGLTLNVPAVWKQPAKVRSRIIEREYEIPAAEGDKLPGRLTMTSATGSVKLNVERWFGQFVQPDGKKTQDVAKVTEKKVHDQRVTIVEISGTFLESTGGGPFAGGRKIPREDYRMLGAIVQTAKHGQYFFKLYGPKKTVANARPGFMAMVQSVAPADSAKRN